MAEIVSVMCMILALAYETADCDRVLNCADALGLEDSKSKLQGLYLDAVRWADRTFIQTAFNR